MDTEQVKLSRKADEPGYCHFRQPYNLLENVTEEQFHESCPLFSDWINRVTLNRDAFIHFIGSIFENNSYNQQYLVLKGSGGDGKGSLLNCLHKFFGPIYAASFMSRILHKDWTSTTYQKRLVTFPDAQNLKHLNEEVFKAITGGNPVPYRGLYEKEFTGVSKAKFIVCTNEDVDVSGMLSDSRRRIYCEIKPAQKATPNYQEDLIEESQVFFSYCHTQYLKHCSQGLPIATDATVEDYLLEESYDDFDSFFCQYMAPNGSVKRGDVNQLFKHQVSRDGREFKRFKRYLQRVHGVTEIRIDGVRRLKGVCIRSAVRSLRN
jgi:phage/plasmid-associated DNA primase